MRSSDWRVIGSIGIILGSIFLLGGVFSYFYYEEIPTLIGTFYRYPYQGNAGPLLIVGLILLVVGYVSRVRAQEEKKLEALPKPPQPVSSLSVAKRFCTNCGAELPANAKYCPSCGQKSEA